MSSPASLATSHDVSSLFTPFSYGPLKTANRIVMAPMTRSFSPGGIPGNDVAAYYARRAANGVGLILTEGTLVNHPAAGNDAKVPMFYGESALAGWAKVVTSVHKAGGLIMPQLWHVGTMRRRGDGPNPEAAPVSASGLFKPGKQVAEPATTADIDALLKGFADSAAHAHRLGFDGIEIHGAHGYLIDQFFWGPTNQRADHYGGDITARSRFAAEIVKACRAATSPTFPILLRFSQWKQQDYNARLATSPSELATFLAPLVDAGVDIFHCSNRRFWEPEFPEDHNGSDKNLAGWTKQISGKPVITVGSVGLDKDFIEAFAAPTTSATNHFGRLTEMMERNEIDLVAVGRALIADPTWANKLRTGHLSDATPYSKEALAQLV
jgi:2,4-dienoyl-CoA reductase-like NADH-dependent reductase (Old Yellow Enzyme family)